jgi:hypothetical protein
MSYQLVRTYRLDPGALGAVVRSVERVLVPDLRRQPGFLSYHLVTTADDRAVSESTWETDEQAAYADSVEAEWVRAKITSYLAALPDQFVGPVAVEYPMGLT